MREHEQTSIYLLLAVVASTFSAMLILVTAALSWELWIVPLIVIGCMILWWVHIRVEGVGLLYENLCAGLVLIEFFFFGVHREVLFEIPVLACILLLIFSLRDRKRLLYITVGLYILALFYHFLVLHTITSGMGVRELVRLVLGVAVTVGAFLIARYRLDRRKAARRRHENTLSELEEAGRQNAEFLSNVSHELRTPINMVIGISEVALGKELSPEIREDMQSIQMAGKRLSSQINNMLDYTEIVEGTLTAIKEEYMLTSVVNDVITMTAMQSSRGELEIVFDVEPQVPAVLIGDAEKISHVLKILLENSLKFTEEGGIYVHVGFRKEEYGINLLIDIYDTGIGMTTSQLTQMYDEFYQADSGSSRFAGGLGLGIPIARGLLHAMGGFVHFESEGQHGLEAHITIPQEVKDPAPGIQIVDVEKVCIACYFRPEKYTCDEIRMYYDNMILHMVEGLGIEGYQAHNFEGLLKLLKEHKMTHVFIAQTEYEENSSYYKELAESMPVVVIADKKFVVDKESKLLVLRKPFFALSVVNLLRGVAQGDGFEEVQDSGHRPFYCNGVRVLVVDDEEMNLVVAKGVLGSYGIQVDTCLSGRAAVQWCRNTVYDIVFLDHMMPGFDGVETLRCIREIENGIYQEIPIVALTANTISGAREMFKNEGFTEFIPKPIERSVLERALRRMLPKQCIQNHAEVSTGEAKAESEDVPIKTECGDVPVKEEPDDLFAKAGINREMGLAYCSGEEEFYLEMLQMFCDQSEEKKKEIIALYEAGNWTDYAVKVHALKSTSLTIGAERLSEYAKTLEMAGKRGDVDFIREHHPTLLRMYEEVCESIAGF
ncbi:MAG: response regulator [Ruminococcus sp.]|nr:response regulator [Ruminococcus sp.]